MPRRTKKSEKKRIEQIVDGEPQSVFGVSLKEEFELANIGGTE